MSDADTTLEITRRLKFIKDETALLNAQIKELEDDKKLLESQLIQIMDDNGTNILNNEYGKFKANKTIMPHVEDWEAVHDYIRTNDAFFLLYKRLGQKAYQELLDTGETVPGVETYTKRSITIYKPLKS